MSLPTPYYDEGGITIYHADCRDILPHLPKVDLVLTDPPYGIGLAYASYSDTLDNWIALINDVLPLLRQASQMVILPCCQIAQLPFIYSKHTPDWLMCWYKGSPGTRAWVGFNDWEPLLVYGKIKGLQMHDYLYAAPEPFTNGHPCPKPLRWATHILKRSGAASVLDSFCGSGTTMQAAKQLGIRAIGIEIEEKYCEIAVRRLGQEVLPL